MAYGDMQTRIAYEVLGSVQASDITNAIQDAIKLFERRRFWFNEIRYDMAPSVDSHGQPITDSSGNFVLSSPLFTTIPGLEFYGPATSNLIGQIAHIDKLVLVQGGNRYTLTPQTPQWVDDAAVGLYWRAIPTDWTYNAEEIRLYPIPDAAYPILAWGTARYPALVNLTDSNPWMVEAERLIRAEAKRRLFSEIIRDEGQAAAQEREIYGDPMKPAFIGALSALMGESVDRGAPMRIRATAF